MTFEAVTLGKLSVNPKTDTMTLRFQAKDGSICEVKLPRAILEEALPNLSRVIRHQAMRQAPGRPLRGRGDFEEVVLARPKDIRVDVSALSDTVILEFDPGSRMEIRYGLEPDVAIQLGSELVKAGQHCKASSSGQPSA